MPKEVGHNLVLFPANIADGISVDVLLGTNWMKAVGICLDIDRVKIVADEEILG